MGTRTHRRYGLLFWAACAAGIVWMLSGGVGRAQYHGIWKDSVENPCHNFYIQHYAAGSTVVVYTPDAVTFHAFLGALEGNAFEADSLDPGQTRKLLLTFLSDDAGEAVLLDNTQDSAAQLLDTSIQKVFPALRTDRSGIWKDMTGSFNLYVQDYTAGSTVALFTFDGAQFEAFLGETADQLFEAPCLGQGAEHIRLEFLDQSEGSISVFSPGAASLGALANWNFDYLIQKVFPPPALDIDFDASPRSGPAPLAVQFTDTSTVPVSSPAWCFGDGETSLEDNPLHTYTEAGVYDVSRSVVAGLFRDVTLRWAYIEVTAAATVQIVGTVTFVGAPLNGVTLTFSGGAGTAVTDAQGDYSKTVSSGWSGTVTPSKSGYTFSPASRSYTDVTANQANQNYAASLAGVIQPAISGKVVKSLILGGGPIGDVTLTFSGGAGTAVTDAQGDYYKAAPSGWSGTVTPSKGEYTFTPTSRTYANVVTHQTDQHYTGTVTYTAVFGISGKVTFLTAEGTPMSGVTLTFSGGQGTAVTNSQGNYSKLITGGWTGTVTPSMANRTFTPASRSYNNLSSDQSNQNYTGALVGIITPIKPVISGKVTFLGAGMAGVTLEFKPGEGTTVTNASGEYSKAVTSGWSGKVVPSKSGYGFSPNWKQYINVTTHQTNQNYSAFLTAVPFP